MKEQGLVHVFVSGLEDVMKEVDGITPPESVLLCRYQQNKNKHTCKLAEGSMVWAKQTGYPR